MLPLLAPVLANAASTLTSKEASTDKNGFAGLATSQKLKEPADLERQTSPPKSVFPSQLSLRTSALPSIPLNQVFTGRDNVQATALPTHGRAPQSATAAAVAQQAAAQDVKQPSTLPLGNPVPGLVGSTLQSWNLGWLGFMPFVPMAAHQLALYHLPAVKQHNTEHMTGLEREHLKRDQFLEAQTRAADVQYEETNKLSNPTFWAGSAMLANQLSNLKPTDLKHDLEREAHSVANTAQSIWKYAAPVAAVGAGLAATSMPITAMKQYLGLDQGVDATKLMLALRKLQGR